MSDRITLREGLHPDIPEAVYHGDPCPEASLSNSVGKKIYKQSPGHAWHAHPRLNPDFEPDEKEDKRPVRIGTVAHKLLLGRGRDVAVLDYPNFLSGDAKKARAKARLANQVPILADEMADAEGMARAARLQIEADDDIREFLESGDSELTMVWREENGIWCRGRIDRLPHSARAGGHIVVFDYKTTGGSADPETYVRTFYDNDHDFQDPFYKRGLKALIPDIRTVTFRFIVQEQKPPYGLKTFALGGEALMEAEAAVDIAIQAWGECTRLNSWPLYEKGPHYIDPPKYKSMSHEMRRMRLFNRIAAWQAPHGIEGRAAKKLIEGEAA